jgi:hypothetical protein
MELLDRAINDAQAEATLAVGAAEADHLRRTRKAEVAKTTEIFEAQARWSEYLAWSGARKKLNFDDDWRLFLGFVDDLHTGKQLHKACDDYLVGREAAQSAQADIIDYRLYWDRLGRALQDRDVVLIDAEQVHGRRTLILFDLDQFRMPVPVLVSPDRNNAPTERKSP